MASKFGKWLKKNIKPIAAVAALVFPPLIPAIGAALVPVGTSAALTAAAGAAALSGGASALAGDKPSDILKNAAIGGVVGGTVSSVSPTAFDNGLFSGGAAPAASTSTGSGLLSTGASSGTGLIAGSSGLGLSAGSSGLGITAASPGAASIGGSLGTALAEISTGIGAAGALSGVGSMAPVDYGLTSGVGSTASQVASDVASKGLIGDVLKKASEITGISEATLGQLGSTAVQTLLSSSAAKSIADQQKQAARTQADATIEAARIAADAAKFRPVGVTTRFGSSNFTTDAAGNVVSAGYTPSAEITGYQDRLSTLANQNLTDVEGARAAYQPLTGAAQSLFNLGQGYLAKSPEQAAADYIAKQQALLTPTRQTQLAELQNKLFQQGRGGAAVSQGGNLMATSPEYAAYYNSLAQQDLVLAAQADEEARRRIQFGSGLFDTGANLQNRFYSGQTAAYAPFTTAMNTSSGLETLAERPFGLGVELGGRVSSAAGRSGTITGQGMLDAARTMAPSNAYSLSGDVLSGISQSPQVTSAIDRAFGVQPQQTPLTVEQLRSIFAK